MRFHSLPLALLLFTTPALAAEFHVNPNAPGAADTNPASPDKPLKSLQKAIDSAAPGDTIFLATAEYPAATITRSYDKPLNIQAAKDQRPVMTGGLALQKAANVKLSGLTFTWNKDARPTKSMTTFLDLTGCKNIEISNCELFDDPTKTKWVGWLADISDCDGVTVRDSKAHHFYFGFAATRSKNVAFKNLDIAIWSHEDGIRFTECEGPVLVDTCHITNAGVSNPASGHVDAIQVVYWTDNLTIKNSHIHGMGQGIGAFASKDRRRKNWHIEGNLIYDVYAPHACTAVDTDGLTIINNTFPLNRPLFASSTNVTVKNNIIGLPLTEKDKQPGNVIDYNLYATGAKIGEHDLVADPMFVNVPLFTLRSETPKAAKETSPAKFFFRTSLAGKLDPGDLVEIMNTDGTGRDGKLRKITALTDNTVEVDPPLDTPPSWGGIVLFKWPKDHKNLTPDFHVKPGSPALNSGDPAIKRGPDMENSPAPAKPTRGAYNTPK